MIDALIWAIPLTALFWFSWTGDPSRPFDIPLWYWPLGMLFGFLYEVVPVAIWGQTIGHHLVGIRVVSANDLGRPGWWRAIRRWGIFVLVGWVPFIGGLLSMLLPLPLLWTEKRQGIHDMVADTLVLNNEVVPWA